MNKALENERKNGVIGSPLAADVMIYADKATEPLLTRIADELRFVLITSTAAVRPMSDCPASLVGNAELGIAVEIKASEAPKCSRCWHRSMDVGMHAQHPELCPRCIGNIGGHDEIRQFA